jgi:hypothetical protein
MHASMTQQQVPGHATRQQAVEATDEEPIAASQLQGALCSTNSVQLKSSQSGQRTHYTGTSADSKPQQGSCFVHKHTSALDWKLAVINTVHASRIMRLHHSIAA